jgi:hypothetical protein
MLPPLIRDVDGGPGRGTRQPCQLCGFQDQPPASAEQAVTWKARTSLVAGVQVVLCDACQAAVAALLSPTIPPASSQGMPRCACGAHSLVEVGGAVACPACVRSAIGQVATGT